MVPLEVWFLGGAILAFGSALWLVAQRERRGEHAFFEMADEKGWDCRRMAPEGLVSRLAGLARVEVAEDGELYLSGPAPGGPFQLVRSGRPGGHGGKAAHGWTFLHLRTPIVSRGLWIQPAPSFRTRAGGPARAENAFARRFLVATDDPQAEALLGEQLRALLMRPQSPVRLGWEGQDLVIAFPLGVASAQGVETLLRYGSALEARLTGSRDPSKRRDPEGPDGASLGATGSVV